MRVCALCRFCELALLAIIANSVAEMEKPRSLLWRMSSGLYNTSKSAVTGTVGMGYGGVKWVAGTSYNVTSAVVSGIHNIFSVLSRVFFIFVYGLQRENALYI